jgi:hypothetical protein
MTPEAALVAQVIVALPEVVVELRVKALFEKFAVSGVPKLHVGGYTSPECTPRTDSLSVTVPAKPLDPLTVIRQVPD